MSLRYFAVFFVNVLLCIPLATAEDAGKDEKKLIAAIESKKGKVEIESESTSDARLIVQWDAPRDTDLAVISGSKLIKKLEIFDSSKITDKGYVTIKSLKNLEKLALNKSAPSAAALAGLKELTNLTFLYLGESRVGDAGVVYLKNIPSLKKLDLYNTLITDKALLTLKSMTDLEELNLAATKVTNDGVIQLKDMSKLKLLDVQNTRVTVPTIKMLEESIKGITIRR